ILPASPLRSPRSWHGLLGSQTGFGQLHKGGMQVVRLCLRNDARDFTFCENSALVQYNEIVARHDLVEQVRGPKHADALLDDQIPYMAENLGSRRGIEAPCRPVQQ